MRKFVTALLAVLGLVLALTAQFPLTVMAGTGVYPIGTTGVSLTLTTPNTHSLCSSGSDTVTITGMPNDGSFRLLGQITVQYVLPDGGRQTVPGGLHSVDTTQNLNVQVSYPPIDQWPVQSTGTAEIHVDISIEVYVNGIKTATLGPGQQWDAYCLNRPQASSTPSPTATNTPVPPSATPTDTSVPPSATPSMTATGTSVPPSSTPTATPTDTSVPPSATPSITATGTSVLPSSTPTPSATPTNTTTTGAPSETPTATTSVPSATPTNTLPVPSSTPTSTTGAPGPTPTATNTSNVSSPTPTSSPSATPTLAIVLSSPTATATNTGGGSGPTPTATATVPSATPTPQGQPTTVSPTVAPTTSRPASTSCNAAVITLTVDRQQKRPGDVVVFTVTVSNPKPTDLTSVIVKQTLSSLVDYQSATATQGQPTYDSQNRVVTLAIGTLAANQSVKLVVTAVVSASAQAPSPVSSTAQVCDASGCCASASTSAAVVPPGIPVTGDGPGPREISVMLAVLGVGLILAAGAGSQARRIHLGR
jgi:uncharacterized repeat protein (TIGR01451 family)